MKRSRRAPRRSGILQADRAMGAFATGVLPFDPEHATNLLHWQWSLYGDNHTTRATLVVHVLTVPLLRLFDSKTRRGTSHGAWHGDAKAAMPPMDHGFMVGGSFYDPDGHHWEVLWMDPAAVQ